VGTERRPGGPGTGPGRARWGSPVELVIVSVTGWSLVRFAHVLAAMGWVGGQLALSIIVLPVLRGRLDATERAPLIREMARRFAIGVVVFATALVP
jgi:uncharacterized membrane protein